MTRAGFTTNTATLVDVLTKLTKDLDVCGVSGISVHCDLETGGPFILAAILLWYLKTQTYV